MTTMIERVARAVEAKLVEEAQASGGYIDGSDGRFMTVDASIDINAIARAAIEAMREPTEAVGRAAFNRVVTDDWLDFLRGYRVMIDAALEETK